MSEQVQVEDRWVPVSESGQRWAARDLDDALAAMRDYPAGGRFANGDTYDGVAYVVHEQRVVRDWHETRRLTPADEAAGGGGGR